MATDERGDDHKVWPRYLHFPILSQAGLEKDYKDDPWYFDNNFYE